MPPLLRFCSAFPDNRLPARMETTMSLIRVQNVTTPVSDIIALLAEWDEETRTRINFKLLQLRPKGGGEFEGVLIIRDANQQPHIGEGGTYRVKFSKGGSSGKARSVSGGPEILIGRKDFAVTQVVERAITAGYKQSLGRSIRKPMQETPEMLAEQKRVHAERLAFEARLVERIVAALTVDDGFAVTNHIAEHRERHDSLSHPLSDGISFTFEGSKFDLRIERNDRR